jgi:hypothetical protein
LVGSEDAGERIGLQVVSDYIRATYEAYIKPERS